MAETTQNGASQERRTENMMLNIGPSHPAMHGVIRIVTELEGEIVRGAEVEIGYLHRCFEKDVENVSWTMAFPYTDRLNYVSSMINNVGWALTVEKLFGVTVPERCQYVRVVVSEISRIVDHLTCIGASAMEMGALTAFLYFMKAREYLYDLIEWISGGRIMASYVRIGGVKADLPEGFAGKALRVLDQVSEVIVEVDKLLTRNRIFFDRTKNVGVFGRERSLAYGITGPLIRAVGVPYDIRRVKPYLVYDKLDFEIPVVDDGDNFARYMVRLEEMRQSIGIIRQALDKMPAGAIAVDPYGRELTGAQMVEEFKRARVRDNVGSKAKVDLTLNGTDRVTAAGVSRVERRDMFLPSKEETYGNIEGLMSHFMLIMDYWGVRPPVGETYHAVEGANGELGFYMVSDGKGRPWRAHCRGPCFFPMAALHEMLTGDMVADIIPTFGSINMIAGELDR